MRGETLLACNRNSLVTKLIRTFSMISVVAVAALVMLALITQIGVLALQHNYPAQGRMIEVAGAKLHVVDIGPRDAAGPPVVMIHGASSNLEIMRQPLGDILASNHRVILIDRPGHGWSTRDRPEDSTPAIQGGMIDQALEKLGVGRAVFVVHSWRLVTMPGIGPLLAYTITLPLGFFLTEPGARGVFLPQIMPQRFVARTATPLMLRPREFLANARDLMTLKAAVAEQAPRYANIKAPTVVISGDVDKTVSTSIHSRPLAAVVPNAKLIVLPGVGHMVQNAAPDLVISEIEAMIGRIAHGTAAAN
jgi:pimeloyl-ACP methyl ester carboxylesterase